MHQSLDLIGLIEENILSLSWKKPKNYTSFNIKIDRCDAKVDCYRIYDEEHHNFSSYEISNEVFTRCTTFNIHLEAVNSQQHKIRDEISIANRTAECWLTNEKMLVIILSAVMFLLLSIVLLICYYHSKRVRRKVRSKVYKRLYSQERYQNPIKKSDLKYYVENKLKEALPFSEEFERLGKLSLDTIERKTSISEAQSNRRRNRYKDIVPYDFNRVPVIPAYKISGDAEPSDYINASFIADMFNGEQKKYIAAQGPGTDTTPAFWQMIWQYGVQVVVMLTSLVEGVGADRVQCVKCNKYWPDNVGDSKKFGDIQVQLFDKAEAPNYCVRKLDVTKIGESTVTGEPQSRVIVHLQLTDWPDKSIPGNTGHLVQLVQLTHVLMTTHNTGPQSGPLLVHCSAGVGRTGTFICVDQIMNNLDSVQSSDLDIFYAVYQLRKQRFYMVQTREQYEFLYKCILHYLELKQKQKKLPGGSQTAVTVM